MAFWGRNQRRKTVPLVILNRSIRLNVDARIAASMPFMHSCYAYMRTYVRGIDRSCEPCVHGRLGRGITAHSLEVFSKMGVVSFSPKREHRRSNIYGKRVYPKLTFIIRSL